MKYKVKVDDRVYEVELNDLHNQPIVAVVNGEPVEVWLESEMGVKPYFAQPDLAYQIGRQQEAISEPPPGKSAKTPDKSGLNFIKNVTAPIPGVVISVAVKAGDSVEVGQALCVLEAMKMKNTIRSPRTGVISTVSVIPGQTVQHRDVLVEYAEEQG